MWHPLDSRSTHLPFLYVSLFVQDGDFCLYFVTAAFMFFALPLGVCVCCWVCVSKIFKVVMTSKLSLFKGQLGVPLTVYPWYLLSSLVILGDYNP